MNLKNKYLVRVITIVLTIGIFTMMTNLWAQHIYENLIHDKKYSTLALTAITVFLLVLFAFFNVRLA